MSPSSPAASDRSLGCVPQGDQLLLGNPNDPNGLQLIRVADLPALAQLAATRAREGE